MKVKISSDDKEESINLSLPENGAFKFDVVCTVHHPTICI